MISERNVLDALKRVKDPELDRDLVSLGMIRDVRIEGGSVSFTLVLTTPACPLKAQIRDAARQAVFEIPGVEAVDVRLDSKVVSQPGSMATELLPGVKNIVAVASGKGGVGKSTIAVNLAVALSESGASVGLLDADIYGPSLPRLIGINERPIASNGKMIPIEHYGIKLMSLGFMLPDDAAVIWRGPLVAGAIKQMLSEVHWGELDYLVVDLPPGTGDAQLTLAQTVPLTGVVIVTTSQDMALTIATKAAQMFRKMDVPVLGIVENMSYFICPHCEGRTDVFSHGGADRAAEKLNIPVLGQIALEPQTVADSDRGVPTVLARPDSAQAEALREMAHRVAGRVSIVTHKEPVGSGKQCRERIS
ncbi:MAG: iron-sulfur cluster carrier protein ApbC [Armatimonadetes bacterium]|nr:iron-sulfur cluster carrier protein ApbC [Armatimonadota bacterium]